MSAVERPKIVVGIDGSDASTEALRAAAQQAELLGAVLQVVTFWEFPTATGVPVPLPLDFAPGAVAADVAQAVVSKVLGSDPAIETEITVLEGRPRVELPAMGRGARMLVVGGSGHGWVEGMVLGSVSDACVRHAACPVLVVPTVDER